MIVIFLTKNAIPHPFLYHLTNIPGICVDIFHAHCELVIDKTLGI